jgi:hypothetical protein
MNGTMSSQNISHSLEIDAQETPSHKRVRFHTQSGPVYFEFSAMKLKEYFYEISIYQMDKCLLGDISFSTVLDMSSMSVDGLGDQQAFGSDLSAILDCKAKEEERFRMLKVVFSFLVKRAEHDELRQQVEKLVEADLNAANITWEPDHALLDKVCKDGLTLSRPSPVVKSQVFYVLQRTPGD